MNEHTTRRRFLRTATIGSSLVTAGGLSVTTVSAQEDSLEASNDQLRISLTNVDSHALISSFDFERNNLFSRSKMHQPTWDILEFSETRDSGQVSGTGWMGYRTERVFEYDGSEETSQGATLRITHTISVPENEPIAITQTEITNESDETTTIKRPESHIHEGWVVSRLPPLRNPMGSYRYHIEGEETAVFDESDLWYAHNLSSDQQSVTYFDDERAITTSYLQGETEPTMGVTFTTADVDNKNDIPQSEENPPARQTPGFSVDGVDLCVEGFSIDPGDTVSFTTASTAHTGGDEAISRAQELTETAASLWEDQPQLQEGSSGNALTTVFRQAENQSDNPLFLGALGAGVLGVGYGAYQRFQSDPEPMQDTETSGDNSPSDAEEAVSDDSPPVINTYSEVTLDEIVDTTDRVQMQSGVVDQQTVWLITPHETSDDTIDTEQLSALSDQLEPWAKMDSTPNLVSVYEVGKSPLPWAAVEQANYPALVDSVHQLDSGELLESLQQVCEAVHHVHRYGTAYRNLTIKSVLQIEEGSIKLRGVLDQFDEPNPWYNAPEEFDGESTERSTIYRIGLIAYELFTGTLPYPEHPNGDPETAVQDAKLSSMDEQPSHLSADVAEILRKALAHSPEDRYETVLHIRDAFEQI